jgi:mxaL protein
VTPRRDRRWLLTAALALAASLADPAITLPRPRPALVLTLDITQSMAVPDADDPWQPGTPVARLTAAHRALHQALAQLPCGSQVGLAVFTEYRSYLLLSPLEVCAHLAELRSTVAVMDNRMAWTGNSEIAKGLHSAWDIAGKLPGQPALVFITDGHEAPPLNPRHRPQFDDKPGERAGLLVGVGGSKPQPIPKTDAAGRPLGEWAADEVLQTDPRSQGRAGSVGREVMAEDGGAAGVSAAALGATPGSEHLSSLREVYLQRLAEEQGLGYLRLHDATGLADALRAPRLARLVPVRVSLAPALQALALAALLWRAWGGRPRRPARPAAA